MSRQCNGQWGSIGIVCFNLMNRQCDDQWRPIELYRGSKWTSTEGPALQTQRWIYVSPVSSLGLFEFKYFSYIHMYVNENYNIISCHWSDGVSSVCFLWLFRDLEVGTILNRNSWFYDLGLNGVRSGF